MMAVKQATQSSSLGARLQRFFTSRHWPEYLFLLILIAFSVVVFYPFAWLVFSSFKQTTDFTLSPPPLLPTEWTLDGYRIALEPWRVNLPQAYANSGMVSGASVVTILFTSSLCGYAFARLNFPGRTVLFYAVLSTTMVPFLTLLVPLYLLMNDLGLIDTLGALYLPSMFSSFGIFLCRQFIYGIPRDYYDAAKVDGAGDFTIYYRIVLPMIKPVLSALGIFTFLGSWGSYLWPMIVLTTESHYTLPLVLTRINNRVSFMEGARDYQVLMATSMLITLPALIVFILFQRNLVKGISLSSIRS